MNDEQNNSVRMIRSTCQYCDGHTGDTSGMSAFATVLTDAKNKLTLIDQLDHIAIGNTKGDTLDVKLLRKTMSDIGWKCGNAVAGYAHSVHNNALEKKVGIARSTFDGMKKDVVDDICETIAAEATTNSVAAITYGMTATDPTDLTTAINLYRIAMNNPRQVQVGINVAKQQITDKVRDVIDNCFTGQMDRMANTLKLTNDTFWKSYFQMRRTIDLGHTTGKIRGNVTDEHNNTLNGVLFQVFEAGTTTEVGRSLSHDGGVFGVAGLDGDYDLLWTINGRVPHPEPGVHVGQGKELRRKIVMMPVV